jgi:hypothetical protein
MHFSVKTSNRYTHANVHVKVKRTRTVATNYHTHANLGLGFRKLVYKED